MSMVLTEWGYLLLFCSGLAVGLFCWLLYASFTDIRTDYCDEELEREVNAP
jgi:hypothetical protein